MVDRIQAFRRIDGHGEVYQAHDGTRSIAVKKVPIEPGGNGMSSRVLREASILKRLGHPHIVRLIEVISSTSSVYLLYDFYPATLSDWRSRVPIHDPQSICRVMYQLLMALSFCEQHRILHRSVSPETIFLDESDNVRLGHFSSARAVQCMNSPYTQNAQHLWYRAPEILAGFTDYSNTVDSWAAGCVFAELCTGHPLFAGASPIDQLALICRLRGVPRAEHWPVLDTLGIQMDEQSRIESVLTGLGCEGVDLIEQLLTVNPSYRITPTAGLNHPYFASMRN